MDAVHNPDRYMADLRQILSQGRKRIGLLVGAGAPFSVKVDNEGTLSSEGNPLIPGINDLTERAVANLSDDQTLAVAAIRAQFPNGGNIETILSRVRLLQTALGTSTVNGLDAEAYAELGAAICGEIGKIVGQSLPNERNSYSELIAWVSGTQRPHAVEIFTTNYDLLFEQAFERGKSPYFDGFTGGHSPFFDPVTVAGDDLPSRWSRLWKLHGSLGWKAEQNSVVRSGGFGCSELVYPDHLKYDLTQKQPYSALFERLKSFLLTPDSVLLTTGFSFRDSHINAVLDETLAMNANTAVLAFQFQDLVSEEPACRLAFEHPNLSVYAADGAVIGGVQGRWRPGDPPKNWSQIRSTFWGERIAGGPHCFLLGDFGLFSRFCALSYSSDMTRGLRTSPELESPSESLEATE